jgi:phospholipase/lecithinase/hemolysin
MYSELRTCLVAFFLAICTSITPVRAGPITDLVIFGDSLSDTGNVLALTTVFQPPPFPAFPGAEGRFSNGPVWVEHLASGLGLAPKASPSNLLFNGASVVPIGAQGGQNFSFGGARTGLGGSAGATTGLLGQLVAWNGGAFGSTLTRTADPNALYILAGGANDLRDFRSGAPGALPPSTSAFNISSLIALLAQAGARHFLVANQPDLGKTPEAVQLGLSPQSTAATIQFNAALDATLLLLDTNFLSTFGIDLDIARLDVFGLMEAVHTDATTNGGAVFGITNVATPCIDPVSPGAYFFPGSIDINCGISAYADAFHPTAGQHRLIGQVALEQVALDTVNTVPEPGILMLIAVAMISLIGTQNRPYRRMV